MNILKFFFLRLFVLLLKFFFLQLFVLSCFVINELQLMCSWQNSLAFTFASLFYLFWLFQLSCVSSMNKCSYFFSFDVYAGGISWICEELYLGSYCLQRTIADGVNLFFLCAFYLFLIIASIGKCSTRSSRNDWVLVVVSLCCALCSIGYFSVVYGI